jgi:hypothetical protein
MTEAISRAALGAFKVRGGNVDRELYSRVLTG